LRLARQRASDPDEMALSPKVPKGRTHSREARPTETKARTRAARGHKLDAHLQEKLEAHARELEDKLAARERELTEALEQQTSTSDERDATMRSDTWRTLPI
jgi:hypothetical protein